MITVKVYKTDVDNKSRAKTIVDELRRNIPGCNPSFDLDDCDNVLRVENPSDGVNEMNVKNILQIFGHKIEELP